MSAKSASVPVRRMKALLGRREKEVSRLNNHQQNEILAKCLELSSGIRTPESIKETPQKISHIIYNQFRVSNDDKVGTATRRNALNITRKILSLLDAARREKNATVNSKKAATTKTQRKSSDQASYECGKENAVVLVPSPRTNDVPTSAITASSRTVPAIKAAAPSHLKRNTSTAVIQQQQQKTQRTQRASAITQPGGKFSLSNFCQANDAYKEPTPVVTSNDTATYPAQNAASTNRSPATFHQPPPYQQKSPHFGAKDTRKRASQPQHSSHPTTDSFHEAAEREESNRKRLEAQQKRAAEEKKRKHAAEEEKRRKVAEEEKLKKAAENARKRASGEEKRKRAAEEARTRAVEEEKRKRAAEEQRRRAAEEARKRASEEEQRKRADEEARKRAAEEARKRALEEEKRKRAAEEALKRAAEEEKRRRAAEEARKRAEEEQKRKRAAEEARKRAAEKRRQEEQRKQAAEREKNADISAAMQAAQQFTRSEKRLVFPTDRPIRSGAVHPRPALTLKYTPEALKREEVENMLSRLAHWDPYWKACKYVKIGKTWASKDSSKKFICNFTINLKNEDLKEMKKSDWGVTMCGDDGDFFDGQLRLIFRMLPVTSTYDNRADVHLWPKGTYFSLNGEALNLVQRKQQDHDHAKWKGLSKFLDLTGHICRPTDANEIKILTFEDQPYFFCVALCKFVAPATLIRNVINSEHGSGFAKLSRKQGEIKAKSFTKHATMTIDDSDDDDAAAHDEGGKFVFTLSDPYSKTIIKKPVRGKQCKHYQCFDLSNFLDSNKMVYGQRYRCLVCEKYISYYDLILDGLVEDLVFEFRKDLVPTDRDRIEYCADGTYRLLGLRKQRYNKKRSAPDTLRSAPVAAAKAKKAAPAEPEIILLDDD